MVTTRTQTPAPTAPAPTLESLAQRVAALERTIALLWRSPAGEQIRAVQARDKQRERERAHEREAAAERERTRPVRAATFTEFAAEHLVVHPAFACLAGDILNAYDEWRRGRHLLHGAVLDEQEVVEAIQKMGATIGSVMNKHRVQQEGFVGVGIVPAGQTADAMIRAVTMEVETRRTDRAERHEELQVFERIDEEKIRSDREVRAGLAAIGRQSLAGVRAPKR